MSRYLCGLCLIAVEFLECANDQIAFYPFQADALGVQVKAYCIGRCRLLSQNLRQVRDSDFVASTQEP